MTGPRFTILMPTHYRPDVIGYAVQSVLSQTLGDFELFVIGDGVTDETREAVGRFNDPRVRFFDFPKAPGFGYANRNRALREARGRLIGFLADDDLYFPDHLERLGAAFDDPTIQLAYSRGLVVSRTGRARPSTTNLELAVELARYRRKGGIVAGTVCYRAGAPGIDDPWPDVPRAGDQHLWLSIIDRHSPACVRFLRDPTLLHFHAGRYYKGRPGALASVAAPGDWYPTILAPSLVPGTVEQAAYSAQMSADPEGWMARARQASVDILSREASENRRFRNSLSWKVTAPIRALDRLIRGPQP